MLQVRTALCFLLSHEQRAKGNTSGDPHPPGSQAPAPRASPQPLPLCRRTETGLVTHSSPGSSLWRKRPGPRSAWEELCTDGPQEGPGLQEGKTEGLKSPRLATVPISRVCGPPASSRRKEPRGAPETFWVVSLSCKRRKSQDGAPGKGAPCHLVLGRGSISGCLETDPAGPHTRPEIHSTPPVSYSHSSHHSAGTWQLPSCARCRAGLRRRSRERGDSPCPRVAPKARGSRSLNDSGLMTLACGSTIQSRPQSRPGPGAVLWEHRACPTLCGWISAPPLPSGAAQTPRCRRPSLTTPHRPLSCPLTLPYVSSRYLFPPPRLTLIDYLTQNASSVKEETLSCLTLEFSAPATGLGTEAARCLFVERRKGGREAGRRGGGEGSVTHQLWQM